MGPTLYPFHSVVDLAKIHWLKIFLFQGAQRATDYFNHKSIAGVGRKLCMPKGREKKIKEETPMLALQLRKLWQSRQKKTYPYCNEKGTEEV